MPAGAGSKDKTMQKIRLDKYLADMGCGTRSELKNKIRKGAALVNGAVVKSADFKLKPGEDTVCFEGRVIGYETYVYYLFHKPAGCVSATEDSRERTVLDYLPKDGRKDLFPVGRLDKDTEGLLLITNDGVLAHNLLSPKKHVEKTYYARIEGSVDEDDVKAFAEGMDIGDEKLTLPAMLEILSSGDISEIKVTICEGRFHQVKRMFEAVGKKVSYLKRLSMETLVLDETLLPGEHRKLTLEEIERLKGTNDRSDKGSTF